MKRLVTSALAAASILWGGTADATSKGSKNSDERYTLTDTIEFKNHLELKPEVAKPASELLDFIVEHSPVDRVKAVYKGAKSKLGFTTANVRRKDDPNNWHYVVTAFYDDNGNGLFDHESGKERDLFPIPNNRFLGIDNSPFMSKEVYEMMGPDLPLMLFRVFDQGKVDDTTWNQYWFQDKEDYTLEEEAALKEKVLRMAADGIKRYESKLPIRVIKEFTDTFGDLSNPFIPDDALYDIEVFQANHGEWYVTVFHDSNFDGIKNPTERFLNVIQDKNGNQISPFIKIDAPNCPTIRGRGPSCPTDDAVAMYTPASEGEGEIEVVQPVQKQSKGDYAITLEGDLAAKLGGHGEIPEPNQGDFNFGARMFTERAYAEASAGLSVNSRNPRSEASGDHAEFVPADMITTRFALRGSVGYRLTDALFLHATGGVVNVGVRDSGNETQDYKISSDQISAIAGGGAVVSLFGDSLALRLDYTFETGKGETAEIEFPNGNSETFDLERVRGHNLLLQATEKISDRLVVDAYAKTEGNTRLFFLEGSSGAYGRIAVGGNVAYVVGTGSSDFLKVGVGVRQQQTDFIPLYKNEKPDTFVGLFVSAGPISDRSKAYVLQTRQ